MRIILLLLTIILFISCKDNIDNDKNLKYGNLEGTIKNNYGQPMKDVNVEVGEKFIKTNYSGSYSFTKILVGDYKVSVTKDFYLNKYQDVSIKSDETVVLDFVMNPGNNYLNISDSLVILYAYSGGFTIHISSNADWQIIHSSNWVDNKIKQGGGDASISFGYPENKSNNEQIDTIQFISGLIKKQLIVRQHTPLKLIKASGIIGNEELSLSDSFKLEFNKPVIVSFALWWNRQGCGDEPRVFFRVN